VLAALLDWLRTGSGTVYVAALAHGSVNASAGLALVFSTAGSPPSTVSTGLLGWTGWLVMLVALLVAVLVRRACRRPAGSGEPPAASEEPAEGVDPGSVVDDVHR